MGCGEQQQPCHTDANEQEKREVRNNKHTSRNTDVQPESPIKVQSQQQNAYSSVGVGVSGKESKANKSVGVHGDQSEFAEHMGEEPRSDALKTSSPRQVEHQQVTVNVGATLKQSQLVAEGDTGNHVEREDEN